MEKKNKSEKNPQNKYILSKYKDYLTDDEKSALKQDALVAPRYRSSKPAGKNSRGEDYYDYSYAPEFKENSMNQSATDYDAGAGRGRVNPKTVSKMKKGGLVKSRDGIAQRGKTKGRIC